MGIQWYIGRLRVANALRAHTRSVGSCNHFIGLDSDTESPDFTHGTVYPDDMAGICFQVRSGRNDIAASFSTRSVVVRHFGSILGMLAMVRAPVFGRARCW